MTSDESRADLLPHAVVACQGVEGAYSQLAADVLFDQPETLFMRTFDGVFRAVESGLVHYGVLPIENSTAGSVTAVYDLMRKYRFSIVRSVKMYIPHMLLAKDKIGLSELKKIYTHEQAIKQCGDFIEKHPHIEIIECANTAVAARMVAESDEPYSAAIASEACVDQYALSVLKRDLQNHQNNYTRFICISKDREVLVDADRISLMLTLEHKAGSLFEVIKEFAEADFNLLMLESRPIPDTDFEFMFYFDVEGSFADPRWTELEKRLEALATHYVCMGNYREEVIDNRRTIASESLQEM